MRRRGLQDSNLNIQSPYSNLNIQLPIIKIQKKQLKIPLAATYLCPPCLSHYSITKKGVCIHENSTTTQLYRRTTTPSFSFSEDINMLLICLMEPWPSFNSRNGCRKKGKSTTIEITDVYHQQLLSFALNCLKNQYLPSKYLDSGVFDFKFHFVDGM